MVPSIYSDIRDQIKPGDILAVTHLSWARWSDIESQIVRFSPRSEFSHVAIAWPMAGRLFILEAVVPEIRIYPLSSRFKEFFWLPINRPLSAEAENFAMSMVGEKYGKLEAIKGFFNRTSSANSRWQCAEYVQQVLLKNGIVMSCKPTPSDIVKCAMYQLGAELRAVTKL